MNVQVQKEKKNLLKCFVSFHRFEDEMDDYNVIMVKALADRLAEVCIQWHSLTVLNTVSAISFCSVRCSGFQVCKSSQSPIVNKPTRQSEPFGGEQPVASTRNSKNWYWAPSNVQPMPSAGKHLTMSYNNAKRGKAQIDVMVHRCQARENKQRLHDTLMPSAGKQTTMS